MEMGIILSGMTKEEVRNTFGLIKPETWYTPSGQEVWHYRAPEEQIIYFKEDAVERVEYAPEDNRQEPAKQEKRYRKVSGRTN